LATEYRIPSDEYTGSVKARKAGQDEVGLVWTVLEACVLQDTQGGRARRDVKLRWCLTRDKLEINGSGFGGKKKISD